MKGNTSELKHVQKSSCHCTIPQSDTFQQSNIGIPHIQQTVTTLREKRKHCFLFPFLLIHATCLQKLSQEKRDYRSCILSIHTNVVFVSFLSEQMFKVEPWQSLHHLNYTLCKNDRHWTSVAGRWKNENIFMSF